MEAIRSSGYFDLSEIAFAILETNGSMSVLPKTEYAPITQDIQQDPTQKVQENIGLIYDGKTMSENIKKAGKTIDEVNAVVKSQNCNLKDVLFLFTCGENIYFQAKNGKAISLKWADGYQKSV